MDTMKAMLSRRSIRKYSSKSVPSQTLKALLRAGMNAPSAGTQDVWHFGVIRDKAKLKEVQTVHPHAEMLAKAPVTILVCADVKKERLKDRWPLDCAAATQNILLAAHAKGLGAVWVGIYPVKARMEKVQKLFKLPKSVKPVAMIPVGYPAEKKKAVDRFKQNRIFQETWKA